MYLSLWVIIAFCVLSIIVDLILALMVWEWLNDEWDSLLMSIFLTLFRAPLILIQASLILQLSDGISNLMVSQSFDNIPNKEAVEITRSSLSFDNSQTLLSIDIKSRTKGLRPLTGLSLIATTTNSSQLLKSKGFFGFLIWFKYSATSSSEGFFFWQNIVNLSPLAFRISILSLSNSFSFSSKSIWSKNAMSSVLI